MENGEKGRMPSLDDVMRAVLPEDMPMHPDHPMQQAEPAPSKYSDVVSDGGMDPRNAPAPAQDEREAFEQHYHRFDLSRDPVSGAYFDSEVRCLWDAWQARASRPEQTEQQPEQSGLVEADTDDIVLTPEAQKVLAECIGAHAYVVGAITNGREDLALAEASKWVEAFREASADLSAQGTSK